MVLRPMTMADADKMLEWKNYPETRKFAIASNRRIGNEAHRKYMKSNIKYFSVLEGFGILFGAIRKKENEISIWVDRKYRGRGVSLYMLFEVSKNGDLARIVNGNIASMRCFLKAGFKPISYIDNYYIFQK